MQSDFDRDSRPKHEIAEIERVLGLICASFERGMEREGDVWWCKRGGRRGTVVYKNQTIAKLIAENPYMPLHLVAQEAGSKLSYVHEVKRAMKEGKFK